MTRTRIGIIGAGMRGLECFGKIFVENHAAEVEIVAVADPNLARAQAGLNRIHTKADIHAEAVELLARNDVDAVIVTSPDHLHEQHCIGAFKHGKHVLVDKPLAISARACLNVLAAARETDRLLYMGFNLRHDPVMRALKKAVDDGRLGRIFSIHAIEHYDGGRTYMARWNRLKKFTGGLWIHKGSHDFDGINWLMGDARPARVSCYAGLFALNREGLPFTPKDGVPPGPTCGECAYSDTCPDSGARDGAFPGDASDGMFGSDAAAIDGYRRDLCIFLSDKDTHDHGAAIVEYDNGAVAMHSECFVTPVTNRRYLLDGTLGFAEGDLKGNRMEIRPRWSSERIVTEVTRGAGTHGGIDPIMCREFIRCIREGERPTAGGIDGAWSVAIGEAAELSRAEKRNVEIAEVLDVRSPLLRP